jgi:hypothetical protein
VITGKVKPYCKLCKVRDKLKDTEWEIAIFDDKNDHICLVSSERRGVIIDRKISSVIRSVFKSPRDTVNDFRTLKVDKATKSAYNKLKYKIKSNPSIPCEEVFTRSYDSFVRIMGIKPSGKALTLKDESKGYIIGNVMWAKNRRSSHPENMYKERYKEEMIELFSECGKVLNYQSRYFAFDDYMYRKFREFRKESISIQQPFYLTSFAAFVFHFGYRTVDKKYLRFVNKELPVEEKYQSKNIVWVK